jgi:methionyl-tRNA formyltransferase
MRIVLLCATRRGYLFLRKLSALLPQSDLVVFSFPEEQWEPLFLDDIRDLTLAYNGRFFEARQVGSQRWTKFWESMVVDLMFVVSWRYMIPSTVYRRPRLGTFVFHDSLLPEYRGFSPTIWAIINGEDHSGVTLFEIAEEIDAGDIVDQERVRIGPDDTIVTVMERVTQTYLDLLERNLENLINGTAPRYPQDSSRATYTCKRLPEDNRIEWTASSESIFNLIRAVSDPYPAAYTYLSGQKMRIWSARRMPDARRYASRIPGRIVEVRPGEGSVVMTGDGVLLLTQVQVEGGDSVCAADVLDRISQTFGR